MFKEYLQNDIHCKITYFLFKIEQFWMYLKEGANTRLLMLQMGGLFIQFNFYIINTKNEIKNIENQ